MNKSATWALGAASSLAIGIATASAQPLAPTAQPQTDKVGTDTVAAKAAQQSNDRFSESTAVSEIIVTAQRREERLQSVPVAVTAITGNALEARGITNTRDLTLVTPGLNITQGSIVPQPQIRGVGSRGTGPGDEGSTPIYVDGIYQATQTNNLFDLYDIQRVEVLKGPQGTLFGRNAQGGAINIVTEDPTQEFKLRGDFSYARFNERKGDIFIAGPLSPTLTASLSIHASADDGFVRDVARNVDTGKNDNTSVRAKLIWKPSDNAQVTAIAFYGKLDDNSFQTNHPIGRDSIGFLASRGGNPNAIQTNAVNTTALSFDPYFNTNTNGAAVIGRYSFPGFDVTATGSFQESKVHTLFDLDVTTPDVSTTGWKSVDTDYTGELRATSTAAGPLKWIAGFFYFNSVSGYRPQLTNHTILVRNHQAAQAYAVFAEGTYNFWQNWDLTFGLRWNDETHSNVVQSGTVAAGYGPVFSGEKEFSKVVPRATLKYSFNRDTQIYATYSQGFKSGLYNASTATNPLLPVAPETLTDYEIGFKSKPLPNVILNLAAYHYDYENLQLSVRAVTGVTVLQNAASATINGGEAELGWAVTRDWDINAGVAFTDSTFDSFPNAIIYVPNPATGGIGNLQQIANVSGNQLPKTPFATANLSSSYRIHIGEHRFVLAANYYHSENYFSSPQNEFGTGPFDILNAQIRWDIPGDKLHLTLYGENLTNNHHFQYLSESTTAFHVGEIRPWVLGVRAEYVFH